MPLHPGCHATGLWKGPGSRVSGGISLCLVASFGPLTPSPIGEVFRARLRQFPSLVNCCTIDWFNEWPAEALESVATKFLNEIPELEATTEVIEGLVGTLVRSKPLGKTV